MLKKFINLSITQSRNYAVRDVNIMWVKPVTPSCISTQRSGDLAKAPTVPGDAVLPEIKSLPEFQQANDIVKTLFTASHLGKNAFYKIQERQLIDKVRRHQYDETSIEIRIATMTAKIRYHQDAMEKFTHNIQRKVALKELIEKRNKYLKIVRTWDYKRFEWLLETLSISFKLLPLERQRMTRKIALTKLAIIQSEEIKEEKLKAYKAQLLIEREKLLKEYAENPLE